MSLSLRALCALLLALPLFACTAGREFKFPPESSLEVGKSTPAAVVAAVGQPESKSAVTMSDPPPQNGPKTVFSAAGAPGTYERLAFYYQDHTGQMLIGGLSGVQPERLLICNFWNGKLVSYIKESSFKEDSTNFDDGKIAELERGKTTEDDLRALFGAPDGVSVYPFITPRDGRALAYEYAEADLHKEERQVKLLLVYVDEHGVVQDFSSASTTKPIIMAPSGNPGYVPIIIPTKK